MTKVYSKFYYFLKTMELNLHKNIELVGDNEALVRYKCLAQIYKKTLKNYDAKKW